MSKAMQLVGIILLGIFTLVIVYLMSDVRSTNELDYYLLQEVTEASMYDAVDYSYYRETGLLKVDRDMFLENFNRRFAESVANNRDYNIKIIDFNETPPKVSVEVTAPTIASVKGEVALVTNRVNGIIETIYDDFVYSPGAYGEVVIDEERPQISVSGPSNDGIYTITMTDNFALQKYVVLKLEDRLSTDDGTFTDEAYNRIQNWINIEEFTNYKQIEQSFPNGINGFWVVAVDRNGLYKAAPITNIKPWLSSFVYDNSKVLAIFGDDRGLASYTISTATCDGNITKNEKINTYNCDTSWGISNSVEHEISNVTKNDNNGYYYSNTLTIIDSLRENYYAITIKDNDGMTNTYVIEGRNSNVEDNEIEIGTEFYYAYKGYIQTFTATQAGKYKLEVCGAQGGNVNGAKGGKGGCASGEVTLEKNAVLYVVVGGQGASTDNSNCTSTQNGGYNGGGTAYSNGPNSAGNCFHGAGGGGATHIGTFNSTLKEHGNTNGLYIVAGGGGGAGQMNNEDPHKGNGGTGGGISGESGFYDAEDESTLPGRGGTQTESPISHQEVAYVGGFGYGGFSHGSGAGGGGLYGGSGSASHSGGGGGSGYIGGVDFNSSSMANGIKEGDGYAKITLISTD